MTIYIGIDWSSQKHDITFLNDQGGVIQECVIPHSPAGFQALDSARQKLEVPPSACCVGIETAHTTLIDYLWETGYEHIYVLPPGAVCANRGRNRQTGARNDRFDAYVIADTLRTDQHKYHLWSPGSTTLQEMRVLVNRGAFIKHETTRLAHRLRAVLVRYYPAALAVFKSWPSALHCHFILAYPTPQSALSLTWPAFQDFARTHHYVNRRQLLACHDRLQAPYPSARPSLVAAYQDEAVQLASVLLQLFECANENARQLQTLFSDHPDAHIFASLPGAGEWLAPALLVKLGEDRQRFPTAASLQSIAGTAPVTVQSGKKRSVRFRRSCDHTFRHIAQQWARCSVRQSDWAAAYYHECLERSHSHNHAYRCLANRWLAILWKMWQTRTEYDEARHLQNRLAHRRSVG